MTNSKTTHTPPSPPNKVTDLRDNPSTPPAAPAQRPAGETLVDPGNPPTAPKPAPNYDPTSGFSKENPENRKRQNIKP